MSVGRICTREVDLAELSESVWRVAERMHQRAVGSLVVVNDASEPLGILTDRDLVERVLAQGLDPTTTTVDQIMTSPPMVIAENATLESALTTMRAGRCRRLAVVDDDGKLVGLVSVDDVLQLLAEELTTIGQLLDRQSPRAAAEV